MKMLLKGNRFQDMEEMKRNVMLAVPKVLRTMEGPLEQVCVV